MRKAFIIAMAFASMGATVMAKGTPSWTESEVKAMCQLANETYGSGSGKFVSSKDGYACSWKDKNGEWHSVICDRTSRQCSEYMTAGPANGRFGKTDPKTRAGTNANSKNPGGSGAVAGAATTGAMTNPSTTHSGLITAAPAKTGPALGGGAFGGSAVATPGLANRKLQLQ
jgi:hypothetical protein